MSIINQRGRSKAHSHGARRVPESSEGFRRRSDHAEARQNAPGRAMTNPIDDEGLGTIGLPRGAMQEIVKGPAASKPKAPTRPATEPRGIGSRGGSSGSPSGPKAVRPRANTRWPPSRRSWRPSPRPGRDGRGRCPRRPRARSRPRIIGCGRRSVRPTHGRAGMSRPARGHRHLPFDHRNRTRSSDRWTTRTSTPIRCRSLPLVPAYPRPRDRGSNGATRSPGPCPQRPAPRRPACSSRR